MNLALYIQHERLMLRRHGGGYLCARLAPLFIVAACLFFAEQSLEQAHELFFGAWPLSLGRGLEGNQASVLLQHGLLGSVSFGLAWLALGLWRLDGRAWWLAAALSIPLLVSNPSSLPGFVRLPLLCFAFLLLCSQSTFSTKAPWR